MLRELIITDLILLYILCNIGAIAYGNANEYTIIDAFNYDVKEWYASGGFFGKTIVIIGSIIAFIIFLPTFILTGAKILGKWFIDTFGSSVYYFLFPKMKEIKVPTLSQEALQKLRDNNIHFTICADGIRFDSMLEYEKAEKYMEK